MKRSPGANNVISLSTAKNARRMGSSRSVHFFGRPGDSLGDYLNFHSPGPDGRCAGCVTKLTGVDPYLQGWFWNRVLAAFPNAHVSWGYRDEALQNACLAAGTTKLPWPNSAHNKNPSRAIDLFQVIAGDGNHSGVAIWSPSFFNALAAMIDKLNLPIRWGGHWKDLGDKDHFELYTSDDHDPPAAS